MNTSVIHEDVDAARAYAKNLAESLWRRHYQRLAPDWQPLPDLLGLLTQIDNMVATLMPSDFAESA